MDFLINRQHKLLAQLIGIALLLSLSLLIIDNVLAWPRELYEGAKGY